MPLWHPRVACFRELFTFALHQRNKDICAPLHAKNATVEGDVIVLRHAPGSAGVVVVVYLAALVLFCQTGFGTFFRFTVEADDAVSTEFLAGMDKSMKGIGAILQNVVCVSANDDTRTLFCQLQDHAALYIPQKIRCGKTVHHAGYALVGKGIRENAGTGGMLTVLFNVVGCKTGFQSDMFYKLLVIKGDA